MTPRERKIFPKYSKSRGTVIFCFVLSFQEGPKSFFFLITENRRLRSTGRVPKE